MSTREPARTEHEARQRYKDVLQRSLSCISKAVWYVGKAPNGDPALMPSDYALRLRRRKGALPDVFFAPTQSFHLVHEQCDDGAEWRAHALSYIYTLFLPEDREFVSWHWHPQGAGANPSPHMHVFADHGDMGAGFRRLHIPTARISFEQVVRFLIEELEVDALHRKWDDLLAEAHGLWRAYRTWD